MPELPEVEITRQSFAQAIEGAKITRVNLGKPLRWPLGCEPSALQGLRVLGVRRRAKYLLVDLSEGLLLVHLGMSGSLRFANGLSPMGLHEHFEMQTTLGTLRLKDPRRFGAVVYVSSEFDSAAQKLLGHLGPEPLQEDFTLAYFKAALSGKTAAIKTVLLDARVVVGVGNIYANEALFLARINPKIAAGKLSGERVQRLLQAIQQVLERALAVGGSTLKDFSNAQGKEGYFQLEMMVYDRERDPCRVCQTPIRSLRQGQRSTFYCPQCQRR
jgi:formamidopyrimidine-DNA glycosylase